MTTDGEFQIQSGINIDLSKEKFKVIQNFIQNIYFNTKKTSLRFTTGEYGMLLFNRIIDEELNSRNFEKKIITNINSLEDINGQYEVYKFANGIEIKIVHNPELDKKEDINEETSFPKRASRLYYES
jgi:hypothetical protein